MKSGGGGGEGGGEGGGGKGGGGGEHRRLCRGLSTHRGHLSLIQFVTFLFVEKMLSIKIRCNEYVVE